MAYEIAPKKDGSWEVFQDGKSVSKGHETRGEALNAARKARGDVMEELFSADGESRGVHVESRGAEAILLLNTDGESTGELEHALGEGTEQQVVGIEAASEEASA